MRALRRTLFSTVIALSAIAIGCTRVHSAATSQATKFTCPMHPSYLSDQAGSCPICGMKLVPVSAAAPSTSAPNTLRIDPERRVLLGLKTVRVRRAEIAGGLHAVGRVVTDERRVTRVQPRFDGFIEKLYADYTGKYVRKGEALAAVYSPELTATQNEFLLALRSRAALAESGLPDAAEAARSRLRLFGLGEAQIEEIAKSQKALPTIDVLAPRSGLVTVKNAVAGAKFGPDSPLFEIADLSRVWVVADVYEHDVPRVKIGQSARVTLPYWPERNWQGRVSFVFPSVDDKTRTVKVRVEVDNGDGALKLDMFADVVLASGARTALVIPQSAVIESGARKIVFIDRGEGRLEPREIDAGDAGEGLAEVRSGLTDGETVADGASFLLDSESQLRSALQSMTSHEHPGATP